MRLWLAVLLPQVCAIATVEWRNVGITSPYPTTGHPQGRLAGASLRYVTLYLAPATTEWYTRVVNSSPAPHALTRAGACEQFRGGSSRAAIWERYWERRQL